MALPLRALLGFWERGLDAGQREPGHRNLVLLRYGGHRPSLYPHHSDVCALYLRTLTTTAPHPRSSPAHTLPYIRYGRTRALPIYALYALVEEKRGDDEACEDDAKAEERTEQRTEELGIELDLLTREYGLDTAADEAAGQQADSA